MADIRREYEETLLEEYSIKLMLLMNERVWLSKDHYEGHWVDQKYLK